MSSHAPTNHRHYLLGGGLSVIVHGAALLGFSVTLPSAPADEEPRASLVWLETEASGATAAARSLAAGAGASWGASVPVERRARSPRTAAPRSVRVAPVSDEALAAAQPAAASAERAVDDAVEGVRVGGALDASGAGSGDGSAAAGAASGLGAGNASAAGAAPVQGPRLLAAGNPCAGYFPAGAHVAHGRVQVEVEVSADGQIATTRVMAEQPLGEGFARAARACAADRLQFAPARTSQGTPVAGHARLLLSFERS